MKRIVLLLVIVCHQLLFSQVGKYAKVDKVNRQTYNFLEQESRGKQYKDKSLYIVYSDRDNNSTYLDELGLKQGKKQALLTPYYVVNESDDFYQLVKLDPSVLGKPKGLFSYFYGKKYFKDAKKAEYVGWIHKNNLLHFSHAKVSADNLKPLNFYLSASSAETLFDLNKYVQKDSIQTYKDPSFRIKSNTAFNSNQLVYVYKYNANKTAALVSNQPYIQATTSETQLMGWVPAKFVKNIGLRQVFNAESKKDVLLSATDTIKVRNIHNAILFQSDKKQDSTVHIPLNVWDHYNNKLINVIGGNVHLLEVPKIKEDHNTFNFHFIFDCSENLKAKYSLQIAALQKIWLLLSEDSRFKNKHFTFSASSFGCGQYYKFEKSKSFALWIDYLQRVFLKDPSIKPTERNTEGLEKCLINIVDSQSTSSDFQNNIVIIAGENDLGFKFKTKNDDNLYALAKINVRLLFMQLESSTEDKNQNFVLQAKQILDDIGKQYRNYVSNFIIDNKLFAKKNLYTSLDSQDNNIYLHDAPLNSVYVGGIVFPKINKLLAPTAFNIAVDSLLSKTIAANTMLVQSLENGADKLGFLRSTLSPSVRAFLSQDTLKRNPLLVPKLNKHETLLHTAVIDKEVGNNLSQGYILTQDEIETVVESYKSFVPIEKKIIKSKHRKALYKKYKSYYKQLNKLVFFKELRKKNTIAELIEFKTGLQVSDTVLNRLKLKRIKQRRKLSHEDYRLLIRKLRKKIDYLEQVVNNPLVKTYKYGDNTTYYYLPNESLF